MAFIAIGYPVGTSYTVGTKSVTPWVPNLVTPWVLTKDKKDII